MASTQKKTANTKKQTTGKKPNGTRKKPPAYVPDLMARGIGAAVCLFLALMVVLGMVGIHAVVPDLLCRGIRGLVGYGFWLTALALFWAAGLLLLRRERRATLRLWCLGLLPVVGGAFLHVLLSPRQPSLGIDLASRLWNDGVYGFGGGVISGGLAVFGTMGFSRVGAGVIFALAFLALLAGAGGVVLAVQGVLRFLGRGGGQVFPARLTVADTALDVRAFCDTGFSVQEPLSGQTVVLVRFGAVQGRLPPALGTYLEQHFAGAAPLPDPMLGVRLVPCPTVAGHCILPAVPASLCCTGSPAGQGRAEHLYAAFADLPPPPDGWEVLVGVEAGDHFQQAHPLSHD